MSVKARARLSDGRWWQPRLIPWPCRLVYKLTAGRLQVSPAALHWGCSTLTLNHCFRTEIIINNSSKLETAWAPLAENSSNSCEDVQDVHPLTNTCFHLNTLAACVISSMTHHWPVRASVSFAYPLAKSALSSYGQDPQQMLLSPTWSQTGNRQKKTRR